MVSVAAVEGNTRYLCVTTSKEIPPSTGFAVATMAPVPAYTYPLSDLPFSDIVAYCVDDACYLVARNPWVLDTRE
jgi:hypothetical protein